MAGAEEFVHRTNYLEERVGHGDIVAGCYVNQPYAQDQHENLSLFHDDGQARFLGGPLIEDAFSNMQDIARSVITPEGSDLQDAMVDMAEKMANDYVGKRAPLLTGRLRNSGEPYVTDDGIEIYRRPAVAPRDEDSESGWHRR